MLRLRGLLIAAVLLVALAGVVFWSKKAKQAEEKETASSTAAPKMLNIPIERIAKIELLRPGSPAVVVEQRGEKYVLTAPQHLPADGVTVNGLASTLGQLTADRLVADKTPNLEQYGLGKPSFELVLTETNGAGRRLLIGDEVPTGSGSYAKLADDPRVFTIASYTVSNLEKSENDLRDRRLITFASDKLTRIDLLAKGQTIEFGKNNQNDWQILKPRPLRADGGLVEELIRKLQEAKMEIPASPEDAKKAAAAFAAGTPVAIASVTDAVGTHQLQVRKDKGDYYAEGSAQEGMYKIASDVGAALDKNLDDFRNKKIFDFGWGDPNAIDIRDGANSVSYRRAGDKWTSGGKTMDTVAIETLIDKLRGLTATQFVEKPFSSPSIDITLTSLDGKRVERVSLAKDGDLWLARRENEPTIYQLDANVVAELQKAIASVKEAPKAAKK